MLAAEAVSGHYPQALEEMRRIGVLVATAADIASRLTGLTDSSGMI